VKTGRLVREMRGTAFVSSVAFSPDGKTLAAAERHDKAGHNVIVLWDVATGKRLRRLADDTGLAWKIAFSPDGKTLIAGSGGTISLLDVATGKDCGPAAGNPSSVGSVVVSPDGRTLAYKADATIRLWDLAEHREASRLPGDPWALTFSPDGKTLAGGMDHNKIYLWAPASRRLVRKLESDPRKAGYDWVAHYQVAFSPDGKVLASGGRAFQSGSASTDAVVQLWDPVTGKAVRRLTLRERHDEICEVQTVAFSPSGTTLAASAFVNLDVNSNGCKIRLWEATTGKPLAGLNAALNDWSDREPPQPFWSMMKRPIIEPHLVYSPDGKLLALNRLHKTLAVWDAITGKERLRLEGHQDSTLCVAFAPDSRTLASAGWDNTIRLWDLASGKELRKLTGHRGPANGLAFSLDGKTLISAGFDTTLLFWDVVAVTHRATP
jgi:WD40 repeat protein